MGQKVNPVGLRLKINKTWKSNWFEDKKYGDYIVEDINIRNFINDKYARGKEYSRVLISDIKISRYTKNIKILIYTNRPGLIIGKKGQDIEALKNELQSQLKLSGNVIINIAEVKNVDTDPDSIAQSIGKAIEGRVSYKRAMKQAISRSTKAGAKGIKIQVSGRLNGADMAKSESFKEGSIPLHTFQADVCYGKYDALTTYGIIGVAVWIYNGIKPVSKTGIDVNVGSLVKN